MGLNGLVPAGVVTGDNLIKLMDYCKKNGHALPGNVSFTDLKIFLFLVMKTSSSAFNCTSTSTINAILQAARDINSPVIIQVSIDNVPANHTAKSYEKFETELKFSVFKWRSRFPCRQGYQEHR